MPRKKISTDSLTTALGASVLQWGIENGFGDKTVSELHATLTNGNSAPQKTAAKKRMTKKAAAKKAAAKKAAVKKAAVKKAAVKKATTKKAAVKKAAVKKATTKKAAVKKATTKKAHSKGASYDPNKVVEFITKNGQAKAVDLKGLVPENGNARSQFMGQLIEQNLIRREGKARATIYYPV